MDNSSQDRFKKGILIKTSLCKDRHGRNFRHSHFQKQNTKVKSELRERESKENRIEGDVGRKTNPWRENEK